MDKHLLEVYLFMQYYKKNITDRYMMKLDNIVLDNDVLKDPTKRLYITTYDNYIKLKEGKKNGSR